MTGAVPATNTCGPTATARENPITGSNGEPEDTSRRFARSSPSIDAQRTAAAPGRRRLESRGRTASNRVRGGQVDTRGAVDQLAKVPMFSGCTKRELQAIVLAAKEVSHP